jgi:N-methylhydantoinase A
LKHDTDTKVRIAVDIGGTFTDLCIVDETGITAIGKILTTPNEPALAVENVIRKTLGTTSLTASDVDQLVHGTTLITNSLIERKGATTALLATEGFRDVLEMAREHRYELYDLMVELPKPLVPRHLRFDVPERILADGSIALPLNEDYVERLAHEFVQHGIQAVSICFLHSFTNGVHERKARDIIARIAPDVRVAISSEIVPEIREYERASTTTANVYVQQLTETYLSDLVERTRAIGIPSDPHIMLSNGGVAVVDVASRYPIRMLESGPAGGALAAASIGARHNNADLMAFDMGGTTAKLCLIEDGEPLVTHQFEVGRVYKLKPGSGLPVKVPVIDMIEIGTGGGSIARINTLGLLTVGPDSAGSEPGPVCYGRGGTKPTVTDADLVLGYLDPDYFLGGEMDLDVDGARAAIEATIAAPLGVSTAEAAWGIHASVNESMATAARVHAVERGKDPGRLPLFTSGGAGPVHGVGVALALGAPQVIMPPAAGVMSAAGFTTAPLAFDFVRSARMLADNIQTVEVDGVFRELESEGRKLLLESGVAAEDVRFGRFAEMRFEGQGFEIRVPLPAKLDAGWQQELQATYLDIYKKRYGDQGPTVGTEVLTWRLTCTGPTPQPNLNLAASHHKPDTNPLKGTRQAYFPETAGYTDTPIYDRYGLAVGATIEGPAIVEERESTLVIRPGGKCTVAADYSLIIDLPQHKDQA